MDPKLELLCRQENNLFHPLQRHPLLWGDRYLPLQHLDKKIMRDVVIIDGVRSPIGKYGGGLSKVRPDDLLAEVLKALMKRNGVSPQLLNDIYAGCGNQAGEDNRNVARMSSLLAGFPKEIPGVTVNRNCASALEAVNQGAKSIIAGEGDVFIGAGVESMSRAPWSLPKPDRTPSIGHPKMWDTTVGWRYNNPKMDDCRGSTSLLS